MGLDLRLECKDSRLTCDLQNNDLVPLLRDSIIELLTKTHLKTMCVTRALPRPSLLFKTDITCQMLLEHVHSYCNVRNCSCGYSPV